jgi:carboxylesterase
MTSVHEYLEKVDTRPLMPGAEPFLLEAGEVGCLLLHGWGGTCDSMRYLGGRLHQAGITAFAPLLPGHGIDAAHLAQTRATDWVFAAEDHLLALHEMCPTLFVVGLSMGAILTLYLGERYPTKLRGIVPINGGVVIGSPSFAAMAFRRDLPDIIPSWDEEILLKDKSVTEVAFRQMARTTILDVLGLAKAVEEMLPLLHLPILMVQAIDDQVLPAWNADYVMERIASQDREVAMLENSYHVATMDYDKDLVADHVIGFVQRHS